MGIDAAGGGRGRQIAPCIMQSLTLVNNCRESEGASGGGGRPRLSQCLAPKASLILHVLPAHHSPTTAGFTSPTFQARAALLINNFVRAEILA